MRCSICGQDGAHIPTTDGGFVHRACADAQAREAFSSRRRRSWRYVGIGVGVLVFSLLMTVAILLDGRLWLLIVPLGSVGSGIMLIWIGGRHLWRSRVRGRYDRR